MKELQNPKCQIPSAKYQREIVLRHLPSSIWFLIFGIWYLECVLAFEFAAWLLALGIWSLDLTTFPHFMLYFA
ncbi:MAG TPA: hypothetical protein VGD31_02820, partial [Sphingobacteriaceae bacterium]